MNFGFEGAFTDEKARERLTERPTEGKMAVSRVTRNYQVTVPREIRELADIKVGDTLLFSKEGDEVVVKRVDKALLGKGFGIWKRAHEKTPWLVNKLLSREAEKRLKQFKIPG